MQDHQSIQVAPMESEQTIECLLLNGTFNKRFAAQTYIDRGCSGTVYRVTDNVDEKYYAVKKIIISQNDNEILQNVFRKSQKEVVRLACAGDHVNIVGYVTAWFEETSAPEQETCGLEKSSSDQLSSPTGILHDAQLVSSSSLSSTTTTDSSMSISSTEGLENRDRAVNILLRSDSKPAYTLFIQMELCTTSLREWLSERKTLLQDFSYEPKFSELRRWVKPASGEEKYLFQLVAHEETDNCLEGIVRGLNHMHTKGYAHRDLHHKNILILVNKQGVVIPKLSDFGSAKTLERLSCQLADIQLNPTGPQPDVGCHLSQSSMSNESIETDSNSFARESKDDMQRLAEVILQLYYPDSLTKDAEELLNKNNWAFGEIARHQPFVKHFKQQARWIQKLKTDEYESRPTAVQILRHGKKHNIFKGKQLEEDILKAENKRLSDENLEKDKEIKRLRLHLGAKTPSPARNGSNTLAITLNSDGK